MESPVKIVELPSWMVVLGKLAIKNARNSLSGHDGYLRSPQFAKGGISRIIGPSGLARILILGAPGVIDRRMVCQDALSAIADYAMEEIKVSHEYTSVARALLRYSLKPSIRFNADTAEICISCIPIDLTCEEEVLADQVADGMEFEIKCLTAQIGHDEHFTSAFVNAGVEIAELIASRSVLEDAVRRSPISIQPTVSSRLTHLELHIAEVLRGSAAFRSLSNKLKNYGLRPSVEFDPNVGARIIIEKMEIN